MVTITCGYCGKVFTRPPSRSKARWCSYECSGNARAVPPESRFWSKVDKTATCWNWTGARDPNGYGRFGIRGRRLALAHRFAYELVNGTVPGALFLDHLCRNPSCVNPDHLEPVTHRENVMRGVVPNRGMCRKGLHPMTPETWVKNGKAMTCLLCRWAARGVRDGKRPMAATVTP